MDENTGSGKPESSTCEGAEASNVSEKVVIFKPALVVSPNSRIIKTGKHKLRTSGQYNGWGIFDASVSLWLLTLEMQKKKDKFQFR